jgi:Methylase involved in ubiquinone/menaquinone biosynthesis
VPGHDGGRGDEDTSWAARLSEPGSPVCTPDWLTLREPADAVARSVELARRAAEHLGDGPVSVRDLGCGTGAMRRWLAPLLPGPQRWYLHDRDPELLARATEGAPDAEPVPGDLTALTVDDLAGTDLVTASALLDLLTADEVTALVAACAEAGCVALFALSVAGRVELEPADPLDAHVAAAFNDHQRRTADGRRLLGPDAHAVAAAEFRARGVPVTTRPSPWLLGPAKAELTEEWLRGWISAACDQRPDLRPSAGAYLQRRLADLAAGRLHVRVDHVDLLATPGRPPC